MAQKHFVYIMTNQFNNVIYIGVTNNLRERVYQHKEGTGSEYTRRYKVTKLVYYEEFEFIEQAIKREKQLKGGSRKKKTELVNLHNISWQELEP
jgi:putative endonuclease